MAHLTHLSRGTPVNTGRPRHRGVASVLAMLFLVLFVTLALGFYAATTTSVQVASNSRHQNDATYAAESALQFISFHLGSMALPKSDNLLDTYTSLCAELRNRVAFTQNVANGAGGYFNPEVTKHPDGTYTFVIPGTSPVNGKTAYNWMNLGADMGKATIVIKYDLRPNPATPNGPKLPALMVTALGKSAGDTPVYRALQYDLKSKSVQTTGQIVLPAGSVFSRSPVTVSNGIEIEGNVTVVTGAGQATMSMEGGAKLTGNLSYVKGQLPPSINNGARIAGSVNVLNEAPPFPEVDTSGFMAYVPPAGTTGPQVITAKDVHNSTLTNIRIKANANTTFNNTTLQGVVFVESPNKVTFGSSVSINGVVIGDPSVDYGVQKVNGQDTPNNSMVFDNSVRINGIEDIDMTKVPAAELANVNSLKFRVMSGGAILAPTYYIQFSGGAKLYRGSVLAGAEFVMNNGFKADFTGPLINYGPRRLDVSGGTKLTFTGTDRTYAGVVVTSTKQNVSLDRSTFAEVNPWDYVK